MYGIAKKFNQQMEQFPMHTHSAIVEMVRVGMQHRNLQMQREDKERADALHERQMKLAEQQMALAREHQEREAGKNLKPELVTQ